MSEGNEFQEISNSMNGTSTYRVVIFCVFSFGFSGLIYANVRNLPTSDRRCHLKHRKLLKHSREKNLFNNELYLFPCQQRLSISNTQMNISPQLHSSDTCLRSRTYLFRRLCNSDASRPSPNRSDNLFSQQIEATFSNDGNRSLFRVSKLLQNRK
jgi:hypothetical protein